MAKDIEISDEKKAVVFKSIMLRQANDAIDEMIENGTELDSANFISMLEEKFKRLSELLATDKNQEEQQQAIQKTKKILLWL